MRIYDNGVYRDATPEEIEAYENTPAPGTQDEDATIEDFEQALANLGVRV